MNTNLNQSQPRSAGIAAQKAGAIVCRSPRLKKQPKFSIKESALCPLPPDDPATLRRAFGAAPQFQKINVAQLLARAGSGLRVVLRAEDAFYARQAAAYLSAMAPDRACGQQTAADADEDVDEVESFFLSEEDLKDLLGDEDASKPDPAACMVVLSPTVLDPDLDAGDDGPAAAQGMGHKKVVDLASVRSRAVLIAADGGPVLSAGVLDQLEGALESPDAPHIFIALKKSQLDLTLLEELRFRCGFRVCEVGTPGAAYLRDMFAFAAAEQGLPLAPDLDADAVLAALRAYRGLRYSDADIELFAARAKEAARPGQAVGTADLLPLLRRARHGQSSAGEQLSEMIGLAEVKDSLRRALAVQILNARRGRPEASACRNLAFCGAPGTGKSVTARLVAQILQDEGCGTGRFVEAGREQLIGVYLGQTSPKIAKLFEQAAGGVLFIDEAGALLGGEQDVYANEAVNALVRHMELHPETMVIFATYEREMMELLRANAGLSSRVAGIIRFADYSDEELCRILALTAKHAGETLSEETAAQCADFFAALRRRKGVSFGNGREARRLFEAAREEMALRCNADALQAAELLPCDLAAAADRLLDMEQSPQNRRIGF